MFLGLSRAQQRNHLHRRSRRTRRQTLDIKGPAPRTTPGQPSARTVLKYGYLFVIFVTFCANVPWSFAGSAEESSSQKIAKDTKTSFGHKGPAPGTTPEQARARTVLKYGYLFGLASSHFGGSGIVRGGRDKISSRVLESSSPYFVMPPPALASDPLRFRGGGPT